jgi:DNA-binding winged helix-turn-helix (wHTH) protein
VRYRFGRFVLSPARRLLWRDGQEIALIPRYFDLLHLLIAQRNRAVNRQEIFDVVWADVVVSDGALTQAIRTIRRGLGDDPREPQFIRTVSRHGYQFIWPDVREEPDEGPVTSPAPIATTPAAAAADDPFARWLMVLLREGDAADATEAAGRTPWPCRGAGDPSRRAVERARRRRGAAAVGRVADRSDCRRACAAASPCRRAGVGALGVGVAGHRRCRHRGRPGRRLCAGARAGIDDRA